MGIITIKSAALQANINDIPKVIHYCWFGGNPLPALAQKCIESWKKYLPDYEIKEWNEQNFDVNIIPYTKQAYAAKKYAFVSDYARLWIVYKYGGVYFDTDVEAIKSFDDILRNGAFMGLEPCEESRYSPALGLGLACTPGHKIYKELIKSYEKDNFINPDGKQNLSTIVTRTSAILKRHNFFENNQLQRIEGITIYPTDYFCPKNFNTGKLNITENTHSIHWYDASWLPKHKKMYQPIKHLLPRHLRAWIQERTTGKILTSNQKKVGIVTFQHDNYGTRLQNYALAAAIKSLGFVPVSIISKHPKDSAKEAIRKIQSILLPFGEKSARWQDARLKNKIFKQFVQKSIRPLSVSRRNLNTIGLSLHAVIAGSDQIWNPDHVSHHRHDVPFLFLNFVPKNKRVAYAPSFGRKNIPDALLRQEYVDNINKFKYLSVREYDGQRIIHELLGKTAEVVPDPTFLLDANNWRNITEKYEPKYPKDKYVATYFLSQQNSILVQATRQYANSNKLDIVDIAGNTHTKSQVVPAPDEFLAIIQNASVVFTDSFHGAVFSIIFNTPFIVYDRVDHDQSSRIETLLKKYSLEIVHNCSPNNWEKIIKQEDFSQAEIVMKEERKKGLRYINKALDNSYEG